MQKISENSVASHVSISPRPSSGATSLSSYLSSSSSNINRLSDQSSLLEVETRSGSINVDVDASSLILPRDDAFEKELNLRVDKIVADRERLKLLCRAGDPSVIPDESAGYISAVVAIGSNDVSGLQRLLDGGLSVNDCDSLGRSLLHLATACGNEDAVRVLVERNGNVDVGDKDEITPLHMAAAAGDKQTVQLLINSGANVNVTDTA
jgi:ankyrin repeat protein